MTEHAWRRFVCWLLDHDFDAGVGIGWSDYVHITCDRCGHSERRHYTALPSR